MKRGSLNKMSLLLIKNTHFIFYGINFLIDGSHRNNKSSESIMQIIIAIQANANGTTEMKPIH